MSLFHPPRHAGRARLLRLAAGWPLGGALFGASVLLQALGRAVCDVSWLLTVAERALNGERLYVDVIESNPPPAVFFHAPAVFAARWFGGGLEAFAHAFVFAFAFGALALGARMLAHGGASALQAGLARNAALFCFVLAPGFSFAQREHLALLALAPFLCALSLRALGRDPGAACALCAGALASLAPAFKPHFALALALPLAGCLWPHARAAGAAQALRAFAPELAGLCAGACALALACLPFLADYLALAPALTDAYAPVRLPFAQLVAQGAFVLSALVLAALFALGGAQARHPAALAPALAALGFQLAYLAQGKGWVNHATPGLALALFAALAFGLRALRFPRVARLRAFALFVLAPAALAAPVSLGLSLKLTGFAPHADAAAALAAVAPAHPRLIALSPNFDVGHSLAREAQGAWIGGPGALWLMWFSHERLQHARDEALRARLAAHVAADAARFAADMARGRPDAVLVERGPWREVYLAHPVIARAMADYAPAAQTAQGVEIWTRAPAR